MATVSARVREATHRTLKSLAEETGESLPDLLDKAVASYQRQRFLEGLAADFGALRENADAWREELAERRLWDASLADGQDGEPA